MGLHYSRFGKLHGDLSSTYNLSGLKNREIQSRIAEDGLGYSWVMIGLGIGGLAGLGALFENRPLLKWSLYIIAGIVFTYGIWQSFFK